MEIDDRYVSATPEGVSLEFVLAGLGSRFTALLIDMVIELVAGAVVIFALNEVIGSSSSTRGYITDGLVALVVFLDIFGYFVLFEALNAGRTPGKAMSGLRVVQVNGGPVGVRASVLRNVCRVVDWLPGLYLVGTVLILTTTNNQRLGDLLGGTLVVRERSGAKRVAPVTAWDAGNQWRTTWATPPSAPGYGPAPGAATSFGQPPGGAGALPPWLPPELVHWDVTRIGGSELAVVNRFLVGRARYTAEARSRLAADLATRLWPLVVGPSGPMDPERFLEALSMVKAARG